MPSTMKSAQHAWSPPDNFAKVESGVYRSAYPTERSVPYLRSIGIKTVALLSVERLPRMVMEALTAPSAAAADYETALRGQENGIMANAPMTGTAPLGRTTAGITVIQVANLRSWQLSLHNSNDDFSEQDVQRALDIAVDAQWHPVLFTTPSGELGTSAVVGCMRHIQHWSLSSILSECELFSVNPKAPLRRSIMNFLALWTPEQYPINEVDVLYRNHLWLAQQRSASGLRHRRRGNFSEAGGSSTTPLDTSMRRQAEESVSSDGSDSDTHAAEHPGHDIILSSIERARRSGGFQRRRGTARGPVNNANNALSPQDDALPQSIVFAGWYLKALAFVPQTACGEWKEAPLRSRDAPPHLLAEGVRNPPALDARSTFTKESIVEEDDD